MTVHKNTSLVRDQIIKSTDDLLYQKGFNQMSFTDISDASKVPRGNINYHFKTKEDILVAVIEHRLAGMKQMLSDWQSSFKTPLKRLKRYAQIPIKEEQLVIEYGCPMGTLNSELGKVQRPLQALAKQQMDVFYDWIYQQFEQLCPDKDTKQLTEQMLIRTQGMSILAHTYNDTTILEREVQEIYLWLDKLTITE